MIKVLSKDISSKIAAGEVIEAPVSVIKELIENSIDAESTFIDIEIINGGKDLIRVTDNGVGIRKEEVEIAFFRHATSKLETANDLKNIKTLGFRGEALASISAVSRTTMISKTKDEEAGRELNLEGSNVLSNNPIGCETGTTFIIKDLFFNTPARLKFLKSKSSETRKITDFITNIAIYYNNIKFRYIIDGKLIFVTKGDSKLIDTLLTVNPEAKEQQLVKVESKNNLFSVKGYISSPGYSKNNKSSQISFINGRIVNNKIIARAIEKTYEDRLFEGRFPACYLFVEVRSQDLDVNIHPNKTEVLITKDKELLDFLYLEFFNSLQREISIPKPQKKASFPLEKEVKYDSKNDEVDSNIIKETSQPEFLTFAADESRAFNIIEEEKKVVSSTQIELETTISRQAEKDSNTRQFPIDELTIVGYIFSTYVLLVKDEDFYMLDQHAAHERVFYEEFLNNYKSQEKHTQNLLAGKIMNLSISSWELKDKWLDELEKAGYNVEIFGDKAIVLKGIPFFMDSEEAERFAKNYIENITYSTDFNDFKILDKIATKACKAAVKGHDHLSDDEIKGLLKSLNECINPLSCPHGRPTFIKLSLYDIERMFKRK